MHVANMQLFIYRLIVNVLYDLL